MVEANDITRATEMLFDERKDFIIIGLTGLTGAGCSTVANLLSMSFTDLDAPEPKYNAFSSNEERKYNIVYKYAKKNWQPFRVIKFVNTITSFLLEFNFHRFVEFLESANLCENFAQLKQNLELNLKDDFNRLHTARLKIMREMAENRDSALKSDFSYIFYFESLPAFTIKLQKLLEQHDAQLYTRIFQIFGNNVRTSGEPYNDKFNPENIFKLSQRTNAMIKILRKRNIDAKQRVLVVIDAIRNPYEATFFKDRYSAFYLFSVSTDENTRKQRLLDKGLTIDQIKQISDLEYTEKQPGVKKFSGLNIQKCLELSDVFLYNPTKGYNNFNYLKFQLVRYISLIMHPGLITPTHAERCMQIAFNAKLNSGCLSRQVGAIVTDENYSVKGVGWNSSPEGQVPCNLRDLGCLLAKVDEEGFSEYKKMIKDFLIM